MKVKICGFKNFPDAEAALRLGATELGFIFTKSPRKIDVMDAKLICQNLPPKTQTIGVFKDETIDQISSIVEIVKLKGIQLHGKESPEVIEALKKSHPNLVIFKTIGVNQETFTLNPHDYHMCDALIFDVSLSHDKPELRTPINSKNLESLQCKLPFYLAGSINPQNVSALIKRYRPQGIDVSSGVEIAPGLKDQHLLQSLFSQLKDTL